MALTLEAYRNAVRDFIKDMPELNRLLKFNEENTDSQIDLYLNMALGFLGAVPPPVESYTDVASFPIPSLLIHAAIEQCLLSNSIHQARNELTYNNGGITVKVPDGNRYLNMLTAMGNMMNREIQMLQQRKVYLNIEGGWGGVNSPYQYIAGYPYLIRPYNSLG
jgi:hypothetical protein